MSKKIFVNLPVKDLDKSMEFFKKLGFTFNSQFTDETAVAMVISEDIYAMLLTYEKFKQFTKKEIVDATKSTEVLVALSLDSRNEVDELMAKVLVIGGKEARDPENYEFMYGRAFEDLDGHIWEVFYMDPNHVQAS
jgi:predicted lactoylglutathione lyase